MAATEFPFNPVRGPAKKPEWAQLIRLGGDRVAILFGELRKSVGKLDGIVERLRYSASEARWVVQYDQGGSELFTVRFSPGLLEACIRVSQSELAGFAGMRKLNRAILDAIRSRANERGSALVTLPLRDRGMVRSFVNLVKAKRQLVSKAVWPVS